MVAGPQLVREAALRGPGEQPPLCRRGGQERRRHQPGAGRRLHERLHRPRRGSGRYGSRGGRRRLQPREPAAAPDARRTQLRRPHQRPEGEQKPRALRTRGRAGVPGRPHRTHTLRPGPAQDRKVRRGGAPPGGGTGCGDPRRAGCRGGPEVPQPLGRLRRGPPRRARLPHPQEHCARDNRRPARRRDKPPGGGAERVLPRRSAAVREKMGSLDDAGAPSPAVGRRDDGEKSSRPGRLLAVFKAVVLLALAATTAYGMLNHGLYAERLWMPVADGVLVLLLVTLFVRGYYGEVPQAAWIMVTFLAALVGVKGLSMVWTVSETETVNEVLRSSTYLALFVVALGALSSGRQVGPLMDVAILMVAAIAGYGLLQKINPAEYPIRSMLVDEVRVDSTLGYANSTAIVLAMGVV